MINRRDLLKQLAALPVFAGVLGPQVGRAAGSRAGRVPMRDYFKELGVRTFINAAGTYTALTSSLMADEVMEAIEYASRQYVRLDDLQDACGQRIAELIGCEAATVTSGAASAITLGLAGVLSGTDPKRVEQVPDLTGLKSEVIMQRAHDIVYAHALRNCGVKIVYIETRQELDKAINEKTALMWFLNANNANGQIKHQEWVDVARKHGIPTMNDCAADVPPVENLWKYTNMGFDLVCFSGGKGIRGPQSAGLLLGRRDLVAAARLHAPPRGNTIGRGMKVNKEEILGMTIAVERYLNHDHQSDWKLWETQIKLIADAAAAVPGVTPEIHVPDLANHVPSLRIRWDQSKVKTTPDEVREALRNGHPSIETVGGKESVDITTWMLNPGEERIVARRVRQILEGKV